MLLDSHAHPRVSTMIALNSTGLIDSSAVFSLLERTSTLIHQRHSLTLLSSRLSHSASSSFLSSAIQPISDVVVVMSDKIREVPMDFTRLKDFSGADVDVNPGLLRPPVFLAESRIPRRRGSSIVMPITGLEVVYIDRKEVPPAGFTQLPGNLNARSLRANTALCVERDAHKSPLIDIRVVCVPGGCKAIADATRWHLSNLGDPHAQIPVPQQPVVIPPHLPNPFAALIPNEYTRVDQSVNPSKDLFLVFKRAKRRAVEYAAYEPFLTDRFPETDRPDFPLETQGVSMLCFPRGMLLKPEDQLPNFMTFVLTQATGSEVYGAALIFYEQMPIDPQQQQTTVGGAMAINGTSEQLQPTYCPRCLCLLSHYPFYELFKTFLNQLYRIAVSPSNMPIERFIGHFFHEIPVPRLYVPNVRYTIGHAKVHLALPPSAGLPYKNFSLLTLFRCLSVTNIIALFEHVLSEGKVVFYSNSHATLTPVAEAIRCLLFPMKWQCVFIPILPTNLAYTVRAPVPFIIGLHRSFLDELKVPEDVFLVDLDRNRVQLPNNIVRPTKHAAAAAAVVNSDDADANGANAHFSADAHHDPHSDTKLIHPLPEYMKEFLHVELLDITTSPLDGRTLLYQEQDLSQEDCSMFQPPTLDADLNMDAAQVEAQETRIRICFLKVLVAFLGRYRRFMLLQAEESESFFDLDRLFDRRAFARSFRETGDASLYHFARQLSDTQIFSSFILQRVTHSQNFQELFFFDYCVALQKDTVPTGSQHLTPVAAMNGRTRHSSSSASSASFVSDGLPSSSSWSSSRPSHSHHARSPSEVLKEASKAEKLRATLKKKISSSALLATTLAATADLLRAGALTPATLEAIRAMPPSLMPMPRDWTALTYEVPPPDSSSLPEGRGPYEYATFPSLDEMKFGDYAGRDGIASPVPRDANDPNSSLQWLLAPNPAHLAPLPSSHAAATTELVSPPRPSHTRGGVGIKKKRPADPRVAEAEAHEAALAANASARARIVVSLFQHINLLHERMRSWSAAERAAVPHVQVLYDLWFGMFAASCEAERARKRQMRRRRIQEGTYYPLSFASPQSASSPMLSDGSPQTPGVGAPGSAFYDAALSESALRAEEHREALADLLSLFLALHAMVSRAGVLPSERVLEDVALFCLRTNLTKEFQEVYRLFSTSVPELSTGFFERLLRVGASTPLIDPAETELEEASDARKKSEGGLPSAPGTPHPLSTFGGPSGATTSATNDDVHTFSYPTSVRTVARCARCSYEMSGEEIMAGWLLHADRLASSCPLCDLSVSAQLAVRTNESAHETLVDFMKPASIRVTLDSLALLRRPDGGASVAGAVHVDISRAEYLAAARASPEVFWNLFFFFVTRGPRTRAAGGRTAAGGVATLPYHFLFSEESELLGRVATNYVVDVAPYRPWRITAETDDAAHAASSPFTSPNMTSGMIMGRDRNISWGDAYAAAHARGHSADFMQSLPQKSAARRSGGAKKGTVASVASLLQDLLEDPNAANTAGGTARSVTFADASPLSDSTKQSDLLDPFSAIDGTRSRSASGSQSVGSTPNSLSHSRRSSLSAANVQYIMSHVKSRPVLQAVRTILRARCARRSWSDEDRREDEVFFRSSMCQTLARLLPTDAASLQDPISFVAEYKQAIASLDATIEAHKKGIETLDAASGGAGENSLDSETAQVLELRRKKKDATAAALEEAVSMRAEVLPCDAVPLAPAVALLRPVRKLFGCDLHRTVSRSSARSGSVVMSGTIAGGLLDDIFANDVPTLEDVLTQVSQNARYTLHGFMHFAANFRTHYEAAAPVPNTDATHTLVPLTVPTPAHAASVAAVTGGDSSVVSQPPNSLALSYVRFWGAVRRWRVRYERNDRNRSLSIVMKSPHGGGVGGTMSPFDSVFDSALSIYDRFMATDEEIETNANTSATTTSSHTETTVQSEPARSVDEKNGVDALALPQERPRRISSTGHHHQRQSSSTLPSIAEMSPVNVDPATVTSPASGMISPVVVSPPSASTSSPTLESPSPSPAGASLQPPTPLSAVSTPKSHGGHVTTIRGIILPRPLHDHIRRTLTEKISVDYVDPLLGATVVRTPHAHLLDRRSQTHRGDDESCVSPTLCPSVSVSPPSFQADLVHHSVPKDLFDDVAQVVINFLKKHVWPAYLDQVRQQEYEEEDAAERQREEQAKEKKAAEEAAAAQAERDAAANAVPTVITIDNSSTTEPSPSEPTASPPVDDASLAPGGSPPPVPPRPSKMHLDLHSQPPSALHSPTSSPPTINRSFRPTAINDDLVLPGADSASASPADSPAGIPTQIQFHSDSPNATIEAISFAASPSSISPPAASLLAPSASFSAALAMPLTLRNVSGESLTLAKSGGHVPDFSSASPTNSDTADELP